MTWFRTVNYFWIKFSSSFLAWKHFVSRTDNDLAADSHHIDVFWLNYSFLFADFLSRSHHQEEMPRSTWPHTWIHPVLGFPQPACTLGLVAPTQPAPFQSILVRWATGFLQELTQDLSLQMLPPNSLLCAGSVHLWALHLPRGWESPQTRETPHIHVFVHFYFIMYFYFNVLYIKLV